MINDSFSLSGKAAVVTGSTQGIGLAIVERLCDAGASCVVTSESAPAVANVTEQLSARGYSVMGRVCDVRDYDSLRNLVVEAGREFGSLDVLVCNAGITGEPGSITAEDPSDYASVFDINLSSMVTLCKLAYPQLKSGGGGSIVLMSSIAGIRGNGRINAYALAKAGVAQLARNLAVQWGPDNVRANAVSPGLIDTELSAQLLNNSEFMQRRLQMTPLRRAGTPREVADAVHFLASDASAFITGHNLVIDGGTTVTDGS